MAPFIITGVPGRPPTGQNPAVRLEINTFIRNEKFFSLYIQALNLIYSQSQNDLLSFFQISAIHGLPHVTWNESPIQGRGYCVHGTNLFPTWHRPYVSLFEQVIQRHAVDIAARYTTPDAATWRRAAAELRQPYWDWASNSVPPDEIIAMARVSILAPNGSRTLVDNPFLTYKFHPIDPTFPPPSFRNWPMTLRHPTSPNPNAQSNVAQLRSRLAAAQGQIARDTARLFSINSWPLFSNHTVGAGGSSNSLESIHDNIHVLVGASGHMGSVPVAAFDPIFYLHHCQVDRLLALWSRVHPNVWVPNAEANTGLSPFWNTATTFWASSNVRNFGQALNYTYPDFVTQVRLASGPAPEGPQPADNPPAVGSGEGSHAVISVQPSAGFSDSIPEWSARIRFNQYELGCSFSVCLFLVEVPSDPAHYFTCPNYVGSYHAFINTSAEECTNCRDHANQEVEGFVHIDEGILKHCPEESLDRGVVVPFLSKDLHWRVLKVDGTVAELPSLDVQIIECQLSLPTGAEYPVVGEPKHYHGITQGRSGGPRPE